MAGAATRVCVITPGHLSSAPRAVREAEALVEAGFDAHLVSASHFDLAEAFDQTIVQRATWRNQRVRTHEGAGVLWRRLKRKALNATRPVASLSLADAETVASPGLPRLVEAALATGARYFHGHCVAGLAAAAQAAARLGTRYGFDAEDFHEAETDQVENDPFERAVVGRVLQAYLGKAAFVSAASPLIGAEYARRYGVRAEVVLNVFPRRDAPAAAAQPRAGGPARLYWFSQSIGPGRGLEAMIAVLALMKTPAELHLRGMAPPAAAARLRELAASSGVAQALKLLAPEPPDRMVALAAEADLGLSLEESLPYNRDLCLTNKVFAYLLAGVPQLLSSTRAQADLARQLGGAALLADMREPGLVAAALDAFLGDPARLADARREARALGQGRYCWDAEKQRFLDGVARALA